MSSNRELPMSSWHQSLRQHSLVIALFFTMAFVGVDHFSYVEPIGHLNITPWNPPAALEVVFLYWGGSFWMAWVYLTLGLSDFVVRGTSPLTPTVLIGNAMLVICYSTIAFTLRHLLAKAVSINQRLVMLRLGGVLVCGAALTAWAYVGLQIVIGNLPPSEMWRATHRFFIGDVLGFVVVLPLIYVATDKRRRRQYRDMWSSGLFWGLVVALFICMAFIFSLPVASQMKYVFTLFFGVGLMAATFSLPGATLAAVMIQVPLVYASMAMGNELSLLMDMQLVMLALALTGLMIGMVVDERMQAEQKLRDSLQLVAAGELAGSLAHELHQPLSALRSYADSAMLMMNAHAPSVQSSAAMSDVLQKIVKETVRASQIVKSLREYFIGGGSHLQWHGVKQLVHDCSSRFSTAFASSGVALETHFLAHPEKVLVDEVQFSTALGNLLKNALETSVSGMHVRIEVGYAQMNQLSIKVFDQGPALAPDAIDQVFRPFYSHKPDGLGLGLSVSKSLIENHGGMLKYHEQPDKCFEIRLPA